MRCVLAATLLVASSLLAPSVQAQSVQAQSVRAPAVPVGAPIAPRPGGALTVQQIMAWGEELRTGLPSPLGWDERGDFFYFTWRPRGSQGDSLFRVARGSARYEPAPVAVRRRGVETFDGWTLGAYDDAFARKAFERDGDVWLLDRASGRETRLTDTPAREQGVRFAPGSAALVYRSGDNAVRHDLATGALRQLTDFRTGTAPATPPAGDEQARVLRAQQTELFGYVRDRIADRRARDSAQAADRRAAGRLRPTYLAGKQLASLAVDPSERFAVYLLAQQATNRPTAVPQWITESGYVEDQNSRPKVGQALATSDLYVQDLARDTTFRVDLHALPGASDKPAFRRAVGDTARARRALFAFAPTFSPDGRYALVEVRAHDNKTRWIARLDLPTGRLTSLRVDQDDAWIGGPGVGFRSEMGWLPARVSNGHTAYFQSEETGFSHLYTLDAATGEARALTSGRFEVSNPRLSRDGRTWRFESSEHTPYETHTYTMPLAGGARTRLTTGEGISRVFDDPREALMAGTFSQANAPTEVYVQAAARQPWQRVTESVSPGLAAYPLRPAEIVEIPASDGARVPARIYRPARPNGAAVFFVHGAGYLQNVHRGWSTYHREYLFHHLLAERGYTVLDLDYRASSGYGRDWRTAIYQHMGGRDLQDYVDASRYVNTQFGIPGDRVFVYGGSYGGFLTLMALFTAPEHFGGGAALRAVTDWAHYNHGYTANILNTPALDLEAHRRSSPIYFAEGYTEKPLLIAHGMVDSNVEFQDVVRLSQRLIELGKRGWEMAVYPVEDHGFVTETSWRDEYRRILEYVERSVGPNRENRRPWEGIE